MTFMTARVFLDTKVLAYAAPRPISYWDAAILSAAQALGSDAVYSEDLNHGQFYSGVRVVNPFSSRAR
jgi:predicted nucleic acid-binding protein